MGLSKLDSLLAAAGRRGRCTVWLGLCGLALCAVVVSIGLKSHGAPLFASVVTGGSAGAVGYLSSRMYATRPERLSGRTDRDERRPPEAGELPPADESDRYN